MVSCGKLRWKDGKTRSRNGNKLSHTGQQCLGEWLVSGLEETVLGGVVATDLKVSSLPLTLVKGAPIDL